MSPRDRQQQPPFVLGLPVAGPGATEPEAGETRQPTSDRRLLQDMSSRSAQRVTMIFDAIADRIRMPVSDETFIARRHQPGAFMTHSGIGLQPPRRLQPALATFLLLWCVSRTCCAAGLPAGVRIYESVSDKAGPTVLVWAGGRPDQAFPLRAVRQLTAWPLRAGRLICVAVDTPEIPRGLWNRFAAAQPDWVVELREDFYYARPGLETRGGSVIHQQDEASVRLSSQLVRAINSTIEEPRNHFRQSAIDSKRTFIGVPAEQGGTQRRVMLVTSARNNVTPTRDFRASIRIRQQRLLVHSLLLQLRMISKAVHVDRFLHSKQRKATDRGTADTLYVAIYDGDGSGRPMPFVVDLMRGLPYVEAHPLHPLEIRQGGLQDFDVVLFPGGMASTQYDSLGKTGRQQVREFVNGGGGYVGICAGAYMAATQPYTWGLDLIDARILDHDHWARGIGTVQIELSDRGRRLFGDHSGKIDYHYGNGPVFAPAGKDTLPDFEVLAWFRTGIGQGGADPQIMVDTPAIIGARCGKGRVLVSSGHAEWSSGIEAFLLRYVEWTGRRPTSATRP